MSYWQNIEKCREFLYGHGWEELDNGKWVHTKVRVHFRGRRYNHREWQFSTKEAVIYEAGLSVGEKKGLVKLN